MGRVQCNVLFNSISVISRQLENDSERLCVTELHLQFEKLPPVVFDPGVILYFDLPKT